MSDHDQGHGQKHPRLIGLEEMVRDGQISYTPGVLVDRISITNHGIRIQARSSQDNTARAFDGERVFLAAGLLESARIVLNSTNRSAVPLQVRQSDIFTIPMLRYRSTPDIARERLHTLCQAVLEINRSTCS